MKPQYQSPTPDELGDLAFVDPLHVRVLAKVLAIRWVDVQAFFGELRELFEPEPTGADAPDHSDIDEQRKAGQATRELLTRAVILAGPLTFGGADRVTCAGLARSDTLRWLDGAEVLVVRLSQPGEPLQFVLAATHTVHGQERAVCWEFKFQGRSLASATKRKLS